MIEIKNVSKTFNLKNKSVQAVNDVSLTIDTGDIYGIIGFSGAGKSTLLRMINQLEVQDEGEILIDGQDIKKLSKQELRKLRTKIGMIFQHFNLLWSKTVSQNIELALQIAGHKNKLTRQQKVQELISLVGLIGRENAYPSELSGGQKQRVAIARALANDPKVLLCDEATSALDPQTTSAILDLLLKINRELNITIIMISHQMEVVQKICNQIAIMADGKVIEQGLEEDIFRNPKHEIIKSFIYKSNGDFDEKMLKEIYSKGQLIKVTFNDQVSRLPILTKVIRNCDADLNVIEANLSNTLSSSFGVMVLEVIGDYKEVVDLFIQYKAQVEVI